LRRWRRVRLLELTRLEAVARDAAKAIFSARRPAHEPI
jgi:hypothetical protein